MGVTTAGARSSDLSSRSFRRILLMKPSSLGDIIHALPVLHALRERYPEAKIDWMVFPPFGELIAHHPQVSELVHFDRKRFSKVGRSPRITLEFLRFLRDLRRRGYDLIVDLQGLFRSGFVAWASGARTRLGFADARELSWIFYTHRVPRGDENTHAVDRYLSVGPVLGLPRREAQFDLAIPENVREKADRLLAAEHIDDAMRFLAVVPGTRWTTKRWPAERFAMVLNQIAPHCELPTLLLGAPDEFDRCAEVARACHKAPVNLAGRTTVLEMAAIVARCTALLCQDSASAHLATAFSRPLVCLIGPTNEYRTGPYRRPETVVRLDVPCSPCYLRFLSQCRHGHRCMEELQVEPVVQALRHALGISGGDPGDARAELRREPGR